MFRTLLIIILFVGFINEVNAQNILKNAKGQKTTNEKKWYDKVVESSVEKKTARKVATVRKTQHQNNAERTSKVNTNTTPNKSANVKEYTGPEIFDKFSDAVFVVLTADNEEHVYQGSGFFINNDGLAITCAHVLKGMGAALVKVPGKDKYFEVEEVYAIDDDNDCALFRVKATNTPYVKLAKTKPLIGERVYAIGSPRGLENTFSSGEISQWRGEFLIQTTVPIDHGSSGGVLLNTKGEAIGITKGIIDSGANLNFACSVEAVKKHLKYE